MNESQANYQQQLRTLFSDYVEDVLKPKWQGEPNPDFDPADPQSWVVKNVAGDWEGFTFKVDPTGYGCGVEETAPNQFLIELPGAESPPSDLVAADSPPGPPTHDKTPTHSESSCCCCSIVCCCCC